VCESILSAPCVFCGYGGAGYYQKHTHDKKCPWYKVGGLEDRTSLLRSTITANFKERRKTVRPTRAMQQRKEYIFPRDVNKYINDIERAHRMAAKSKLRFDGKTSSVA